MTDALNQLEELAAGGIAHARFAHDVEIRSDDFAAVDRILVKERLSVTPNESEMLAACYGAWAGMWAVKTLNARWVGLHEPCSPRLLVGGVTCSPIDAVKRFLTDSLSPTSLVSMQEQMRAWSERATNLSNAININAAAWDRLTDDERFAGEIPLPRNRQSAIEALDPWLAADWSSLTNSGQQSCRLLCLGSGGGRQGPLHAIAGAEVTVVDISANQLDHDRRVAAKHGLSLTLHQSSADGLDGLLAASFDVVVQPVSACYLPDIRKMYSEVARVLRPNGIYLVQHKQPVAMVLKPGPAGDYIVSEPAIQGQPLPVRSDSGDDVCSAREPGTIEYSHSLQTLIGELCAAGLVITHFAEPPRADAFALPGTAEHRACFVPPYFKLKALNQSQQ